MFLDIHILKTLSDPMFWAWVVLLAVGIGIISVIADFLTSKDKPRIRKYHYTGKGKRLHRV